MKKANWAALLLTGLLAACAATESMPEKIGQISRAAAGQGEAVDEMLFINVPSAGNPVSDGMQLAALAAGTRSIAVEGVTEILKARPKQPLGIVGDSRAMNVATLKRALKDLPVVAGAREYRVYLYATPDQQADLQQAAESKNIRIYGLQ